MRCAGRTVTLPRPGRLRTHECTRKLARRLENGTARILPATVTRTAQRWFVSFTVGVDRAVPQRHARPGSAIGTSARHTISEDLRAEGFVGGQRYAFAVGPVKPLVAQARAYLGDAVLPIPPLEILPPLSTASES